MGVQSLLMAYHSLVTDITLHLAWLLLAQVCLIDIVLHFQYLSHILSLDTVDRGIYATSNRNTIKENNIGPNAGTGIYVDTDTYNNSVEGNRIKNCDRGIANYGDWTSMKVKDTRELSISFS